MKKFAILCVVLALCVSSTDAFAKGKKGDVYVEGDAAQKGSSVKSQKSAASKTTNRIKMTPQTGQKGTTKPGW